MNKHSSLFIICTLLIILVYGFTAVEKHYSVEDLDSPICLYKDTKKAKDDKVKESKSKGNEKLTNLHPLSTVHNQLSIVRGLVTYHGLATFDRNANIGCFNKFIMQ